MRVLHLDAGTTMRGGQWQALRLMEGLAAEGVESTLLAPEGAPLVEAARQAGVRALPLGLARTAWEARRHDLTHAHDSRSHTLAALAGAAPLIVSRRVAFGGAEGALSRWKYGRAARYIAVSEHVKSVLAARGVPESAIAVAYDGVRLAPLPAPLVEDAAAPAPFLALANAEDPRKGAALAAEAARLAGVELRFSAQPERDLPGARAFVYITYSEGLGSGALLAMAAGAPVIASAVGGLREIVRHGENGLLVENTPEAIAAAMRQMDSGAALRTRLGAAGRRTVEERFTVEIMVRRTIEVYREAMTPRRAGAIKD
jgi:hypothetical protein